MPWFVRDVQRNVYTKHYAVTEMTEFPRDPRRRTRAWEKAILAQAPFYPIAIGLLTWIPAVVFGARIDPVRWHWFVPGFGVWWMYLYDTVHYHSAAVDAQVHQTFLITRLVAAAVALAGAVLGCFVFERWLLDERGLSTEHGSTRWAYPEDLIVYDRPQDRLLPDDYDIHRGFGNKSKLELLHIKGLSDRLRIDRAIVSKEAEFDTESPNRISGPKS